ncbi:MAG: nitrogen regulation protein NR(II) [Gammaproteobacteria bacterium]|nr:nitrogen regulation protein NR(II) [Gammaproteobacteria bacterium]MDD9895694.1 nitrogen regulation protein NR(II) [Gammaproteobacteria bacterium]MDD9960127.1 nitrogen regulation protein NR(II) [Gammaproteobacteria bacterium]
MTLENVHKRLLDQLKTGVVLLDSNLRLLYINIAAEALLEISDKKARHLFIGDIITNAEEDIGEMQTAMVKNSSFTKRKAELNVMRDKTIFVDYTLSPFEYEGESKALMEINSLEHSQRISREESLNSAHATTRELVRGLAHEIKNPLGGIRGAAQLLSNEIAAGELTDYTNVIIEEADRLHNLVDRMVGSRKPLELREINIHEVLERVRQLVSAEVSGDSIRLAYDYDPSIPAIYADSEQLIQAMLNLVRNAVQSLSSPDVDHGLGEILLRSRIVRNTTIGSRFHRLAAGIEVIDNGPGIPEDMIDTIFYPMISGRADGTGLGLPITHGIVNQHHGMIEVNSKAGKTKFTVVIPFGNHH